MKQTMESMVISHVEISPLNLRTQPFLSALGDLELATTAWLDRSWSFA
jgi:hypothetical protein